MKLCFSQQEQRKINAMHHLTCVYCSDVSVILVLNSIWKYSGEIVTLNKTGNLNGYIW